MSAADLAAIREALTIALDCRHDDGLCPECSEQVAEALAALARVEADTLTLEQSRETALRKVRDWQAIAADRLERIESLEADTLTPEEARLFLALLADEPEWNSQPEIRAKLERIAGDTGEAT